MTEERSILLAAGGTGGHLFPAFALAEELGRRGYAVDLATDMRGDRYGTGFPARAIYEIPSATLKDASPRAVTETALILSRGVFAAYRLLARIRPRAVIGFGGYPTFPPVLAARMRGIPSALHEQNAVLGRANRMLARRVDRIATSFATTAGIEGPLKLIARFTGNPVRAAVVRAADRSYVPPRLIGPVSLLVFGGSQGARFFSDVLPAALAGVTEDLRRRLAVVQQAREEDVERVSEAYRRIGIRARVAPFFPDLPDLMAQAHLVIARSGASTVAELAVIGRPAILVPLPHSLDNDQLVNATRLAEAGGGWCVAQADITAEQLAGDIGGLFAAPAMLTAAAEAARAAGRPDAVLRLADLVEDLARGRAAADQAMHQERD